MSATAAATTKYTGVYCNSLLVAHPSASEIALFLLVPSASLWHFNTTTTTTPQAPPLHSPLTCPHLLVPVISQPEAPAAYVAHCRPPDDAHNLSCAAAVITHRQHVRHLSGQLTEVTYSHTTHSQHNGSTTVLQVMSVWCEGRREDWFCTHIGWGSLRAASAIAFFLHLPVSTCVPPPSYTPASQHNTWQWL